MDLTTTPLQDGFRMPAEWESHQCCFMAWPTRRSLWGETFEQAKLDYAEVARTISRFEPVVMICNPAEAADARDHCGSAIEFAEIDIDDSWTRDSGPVFVVNEHGEVAAVDFGFDGWGGKYEPCDRDAALGRMLSDVLGCRRFPAPMVLEGGAFFVDGQGTLVTTDGPTLDARRNADISRTRFEEIARDYLGASKVLWLVAFPDRDTDGHIDGIAQYVRPGELLLLTPDDPGHENYESAAQNVATLGATTDAMGRPIKVHRFDVTARARAGGELVDLPYLNCYLANGAVIAPIGAAADRTGSAADEASLARLAEVFPDREVVGVPGAVLSYGGGGPHCITQQMPLATPVPR
jgi:agmatine deiminase